jgi:hypothetical protein
LKLALLPFFYVPLSVSSVGCISSDYFFFLLILSLSLDVFTAAVLSIFTYLLCLKSVFILHRNAFQRVSIFLTSNTSLTLIVPGEVKVDLADLWCQIVESTYSKIYLTVCTLLFKRFLLRIILNLVHHINKLFFWRTFKQFNNLIAPRCPPPPSARFYCCFRPPEGGGKAQHTVVCSSAWCQSAFN